MKSKRARPSPATRARSAPRAPWAALDAWKADVPGHEALLALHLQLRDEIRRRHRRSVSFPDELFDRWERARWLGFGTGSSVYENVLIKGDVRVGRDTWIGPDVILDGDGGLTIGSHCAISAGVHIYTHDSIARQLTGGRAKIQYSPVRIGDCCYLGPHAIVARGVTIGRQSVVGALSLVQRDVPPRTFVAGCPARVLGRIVVKGARVRIERVGGDDGPKGA